MTNKYIQKPKQILELYDWQGLPKLTLWQKIRLWACWYYQDFKIRLKHWVFGI